MALYPRLTAVLHALRYTSVLPLPVTPESSTEAPLPKAASTRATAAACSSVSSAGGSSPTSPAAASTAADLAPTLPARGRRSDGAISPSARAGVDP